MLSDICIRKKNIIEVTVVNKSTKTYMEVIGMKIGSMNGTNNPVMQTRMSGGADATTKHIQKQIDDAKKQLQELSEKEDMSSEEKMMKRQEINQKIMDLNQQLRQHQMQQRKEKKETSSADDMLGTKQVKNKAGKTTGGLSQANMQAIISADSAINQAGIQGSVASKMEGRASVLEMEIKLDASRGENVNVEAKQEEMAEAKQKSLSAETAQISTLAEANKELEEAAKEEGGTKAEGTTETDTEKKTDNQAKEDVKAGEKSNIDLHSENANKNSALVSDDLSENEEKASEQGHGATSIDVYL